MSEQSITAPTAAAAEDTRPSTPEARAGAARIRLRQERAASAEPAADAGTQPERDTTAEPPTAPAEPTSATDDAGPIASAADSAPGDEPSADDELAKARAARAERLAQRQAAIEAERARRQDERKPPPVDPKVAEELAALKKRLADPEEFFRLANEHKVSPAQMAEFLRTSIEAPEEVAAKRVREEMRAELEALRAELESERQTRAELEQQRQLAHVQNLVVEHTAANAKTAPYSARFMERQGREAFLAYADKVATTLGDGFDIADLHDAIESNLERLADVYGGASASTQPTQTHAAAKAPTQTITNALAATRTTVGDEESMEDGPRPSLMERTQRARQRFRLG